MSMFINSLSQAVCSLKSDRSNISPATFTTSYTTSYTNDQIQSDSVAGLRRITGHFYRNRQRHLRLKQVNRKFYKD